MPICGRQIALWVNCRRAAETADLPTWAPPGGQAGILRFCDDLVLPIKEPKSFLRGLAEGIPLGLRLCGLLPIACCLLPGACARRGARTAGRGLMRNWKSRRQRDYRRRKMLGKEGRNDGWMDGWMRPARLARTPGEAACPERVEGGVLRVSPCFLLGHLSYSTANHPRSRARLALP